MGLSVEEKKLAIAAAWAEYRAASIAIPQSLPFSGGRHNGEWRDGYLEYDVRLWQKYLAAEAVILKS